VIICEPCDRYGRYNVRRLIAKHGADMRLPELKTIPRRLARKLARSASTTGARSATSSANRPSSQSLPPSVFDEGDGPRSA
jgi:hypothetical protein